MPGARADGTEGARAPHHRGVRLCGSHWRVLVPRNAIVAGNPLPSLSLSLGPFSLPSVKGTLPTSMVAKFLFDGPAWIDYFIPGLRSSARPRVGRGHRVSLSSGSRRPSNVPTRSSECSASWVSQASRRICSHRSTSWAPSGGHSLHCQPAVQIQRSRSGSYCCPIVSRRWRSWTVCARARACCHTTRPDSVADGIPMGDVHHPREWP